MPRGNQKEPIDLILAKGKAHFTKAQIEERRRSEIKVKYTDIMPPDYLSEEQKDEFMRIATILLSIGIMSELDEECLAHYLIANTNYVSYTNELKNLNIKLQKAKKTEQKQKIMSQIDLYLTYQDRALKQSRLLANDMGLTISSRCKLVMPPPKDPPKENKFAKFKVVG